MESFWLASGNQKRLKSLSQTLRSFEELSYFFNICTLNFQSMENAFEIDKIQKMMNSFINPYEDNISIKLRMGNVILFSKK